MSADGMHECRCGRICNWSIPKTPTPSSGKKAFVTVVDRFSDPWIEIDGYGNLPALSISDAKRKADRMNAILEDRVSAAVRDFAEKAEKAVCRGCRQGWKLDGDYHQWPDDGQIYVGLCRCKASAIRSLSQEPPR